MARFNRLDNQAPVQSELQASKINVGRSAFDFSHVHSGTAIIGALTPVLNMEVVPHEDIDISLNALIQLRNPLVRPLLNGMRVYFHGYVDYLVNIWEGAKNFIDAGRSGKVSLARPKLVWKATDSLGNRVNAATPLSLLDYLGLPAEIFVKTIGDSVSVPPLRSFQAFSIGASAPVSSYVKLAESPDYFPADCCFMYQRVWRDFYSNKNLLMNNKYWFPENEEDFIIDYDATECVQIQKGNELPSNPDDVFYSLNSGSALITPGHVLVTPEANNPRTVSVPGSDWLAPNLCGLKFRQFKGDRFTSGSPFPDLVRGDIPLLHTTSDVQGNYGFRLSSRPDVTANFYANQATTPTGFEITLSDGTRRQSGFLLPNVDSHVTLNDIRALETFTVFKERMARTNGDYNDMVEAQYGYNPKHEIREATYIGGFYVDFNFSTVVQTSESSGDNPLGSKSGDANASGTGSIGHIHTRDFGWIQVYMSIVPDVMYSQGIERQFSKKIQTDMYFPLFNNLAPQAILNKEIFVSGDPAVDKDVFAYEDRYAEYKSRNNRVSGFMALSHEVAEFDASRIMFRRFKSTPAFNSQFTTLVPENVDMQVFTVYDEPPFDFQIGFNIRRVFPGPYTAIPGSMSSNLHA